MKSLELDINRMSAIAGALAALDGREVVVGEGPAARSVQVAYKLGSLRHPIAKNLRALRMHLDTFNEARTALIKELSGGSGTIDGAKEPDKMAKFNEQVTAMVANKATVELETLPVERLKLDINEIPPAVLEALGDILDDGEPKQQIAA